MGRRSERSAVVRSWLRTAFAVALIYAGAAVLSLAIEFDNFSTGPGPLTGDEVVYVCFGSVGALLVAAPFVWHLRAPPVYGTAVAVLVPLAAAIAAHVLLRHYDERHADIALAVVAIAPAVALALVGRRVRRQLFVGATALTAIGWFVVLAVAAS